jgi:hypothetical protein
VLNALGENSDHLPVTLKLSVDQHVGIDEYQYSLFTDLSFVNPVDDFLHLQITAQKATRATFSVFDVAGKLRIRQTASISKGKSAHTLNISGLPAGLYILHLADNNGVAISRKMVKQ